MDLYVITDSLLAVGLAIYKHVNEGKEALLLTPRRYSISHLWLLSGTVGW